MATLTTNPRDPWKSLYDAHGREVGYVSDLSLGNPHWGWTLFAFEGRDAAHGQARTKREAIAAATAHVAAHPIAPDAARVYPEDDGHPF